MPTETNIGPCECCYERCLCSNHPASLQITIESETDCDCGVDTTGTTYELTYWGLFGGLGLWRYESDDCGGWPHVTAPEESYYFGRHSPGFSINFQCLNTNGYYRVTIQWTDDNPVGSGSPLDDWRTEYRLEFDVNLGSKPSCGSLNIDMSGSYPANKFAIDLPNSGSFLPCPGVTLPASITLTVTVTL